MATLTLTNLEKHFPGNVRAVDRLSLTVDDGELLVLFGPSGCGKTTTLRLIAGLETPTGGTIAIDEQTVDNLPPRDRDVAMVFQDHALYPHMTIRRNMAFPLAMRKIPRAEIRRRVDEAAELLRLGDLLDRRPGELSGGQRQRVALGRAIVRKPKLFLLDEPLSNLEAGLRAELRREIARLHQRLGVTTIYVTHDQTEAMTLAGRIAVLRDGQLQQVDDPAALYHHPANRFVASAIGDPTMNFFDGRIVQEESELVFRAERCFLPIPGPWITPLQSHIGNPITLGIRPEHIGPAIAKGDAVVIVSARVEAVESLGPESHLHLTAGHDRFTCRVTAVDAYQLGQSIDLSISTDALHFFDSHGDGVDI